MSKYELSGPVRVLHEPKTFASGFTKREFVVETEGKYPQLIKLECVKDGVKNLDGIRVNDVVEVAFDIRGSEYNGKHYVNLVAWKVTATGETAQPNESTRQGRDIAAKDATYRGNKSAPQTQSADDDEDDTTIPF